MKKVFNLLFTLCLISLILIHMSCNKDSDFGAGPYEGAEHSDSLITKIHLEVDGFENLEGKLAIAIFNTEQSFNAGNETYKDSTLSINTYNMEVIINDIDPGEYVISVFHDFDENGELTLTSFLGFDIPAEGFGFSNNPTIGFSQPTYNDCRFNIEEQETLIVPITLQYL